MPNAARILLVSPDLMVASRIAGLAAQCGATIAALHGGAAPAAGSAYDLVLVDLQSGTGDAGELITGIRERLAAHGPHAGVGPALVAFGPHVAVDRLAAARAAGADVVSRGELLGTFPAIVARHVG